MIPVWSLVWQVTVSGVHGNGERPSSTHYLKVLFPVFLEVHILGFGEARQR